MIFNLFGKIELINELFSRIEFLRLSGSSLSTNISFKASLKSKLLFDCTDFRKGKANERASYLLNSYTVVLISYLLDIALSISLRS